MKLGRDDRFIGYCGHLLNRFKNGERSIPMIINDH